MPEVELYPVGVWIVNSEEMTTSDHKVIPQHTLGIVQNLRGSDDIEIQWFLEWTNEDLTIEEVEARNITATSEVKRNQIERFYLP